MNDTQGTDIQDGLAGSEPILASLVLLDKQGTQTETFPIQHKITTMGRSADNDVRFLKNGVSRLHCTIEIDTEKQQAFLIVSGANGVLLNRAQVMPEPNGSGTYPLANGDEITLAKITFRFELEPNPTASTPSQLTFSPTKSQAHPLQTPVTNKTRRIRMSFVNLAQLDTPSNNTSNVMLDPSSPSKSPSKRADRASRRQSGINLLMQNSSISRQFGGRKSLATSTLYIPSTPNRRSNLQEPMTAPSKRVVFNMSTNDNRARLSPVKGLRPEPLMEAMVEEQEEDQGPLDDEMRPEELVLLPREESQDQDSSLSEQSCEDDDLIVFEELEEEDQDTQAQPKDLQDELQQESEPSSKDQDDRLTMTPASPPQSEKEARKAKKERRRSSFLGRAGPLKDVNLGFYSEERKELEQSETERNNQGFPEIVEEPAELSQEDQELSSVPSPALQDFSSLTPLPRKPRLSSPNKRRVSLRTQTLLRSSAQYYDRLFVPPPPRSLFTSPTKHSGGLIKSTSLPSNISSYASPPSRPIKTLQTPRSIPLPPSVPGTPDYEQDMEDEDEVDRSLSLAGSFEDSSDSPEPPKTGLLFSPVRPNTVPPFQTPQAGNRQTKHDTHRPRVSLPVLASPKKSTLIRLHIGGGGSNLADSLQSGLLGLSLGAKPKKVIRVSDVGLPASEMSRGYEIEDELDEEEEEEGGEELAAALNDLFEAEDGESTDGEESEDDEKDHPLAAVSSLQLPGTTTTSRSSMPPPLSPASATHPKTIATSPRNALKSPAIDVLRHLFATQPEGLSTPKMDGVKQLFTTPSPSKKPSFEYGSLHHKMRADPEKAELISLNVDNDNKSTRQKQGIRAAALAQTPDMRGIKKMFSEPKVELQMTPDLRFLRHVFALSSIESDQDPSLLAVRQMFQSHEKALTAKSANLLDTDKEVGKSLKELLATPAAKNCIVEAASSVVAGIGSAHLATGSGRENVIDLIASPSVRKSGNKRMSLGESLGVLKADRRQSVTPQGSPNKEKKDHRTVAAEPVATSSLSPSPVVSTSQPLPSNSSMEGFLTVTVFDSKGDDFENTPNAVDSSSGLGQRDKATSPSPFDSINNCSSKKHSINGADDSKYDQESLQEGELKQKQNQRQEVGPEVAVDTAVVPFVSVDQNEVPLTPTPKSRSRRGRNRKTAREEVEVEETPRSKSTASNPQPASDLETENQTEATSKVKMAGGAQHPLDGEASEPNLEATSTVEVVIETNVVQSELEGTSETVFNEQDTSLPTKPTRSRTKRTATTSSSIPKSANRTTSRRKKPTETDSGQHENEQTEVPSSSPSKSKAATTTRRRKAVTSAETVLSSPSQPRATRKKAVATGIASSSEIEQPSKQRVESAEAELVKQEEEPVSAAAAPVTKASRNRTRRGKTATTEEAKETNIEPCSVQVEPKRKTRRGITDIPTLSTGTTRSSRTRKVLKEVNDNKPEVEVVVEVEEEEKEKSSPLPSSTTPIKSKTKSTKTTAARVTRSKAVVIDPSSSSTVRSSQLKKPSKTDSVNATSSSPSSIPKVKKPSTSRTTRSQSTVTK